MKCAGNTQLQWAASKLEGSVRIQNKFNKLEQLSEKIGCWSTMESTAYHTQQE